MRYLVAGAAVHHPFKHNICTSADLKNFKKVAGVFGRDENVTVKQDHTAVCVLQPAG